MNRLMFAIMLTIVGGAGLIGASQNKALVVPEMHWSFDRLAGTHTVLSENGSKAVGTIVRSRKLKGPFKPVLQGGMSGKALLCGGSGQFGYFMEVKNPPRITGPFSVSLWIKPLRGQWSTRVLYHKPNWLSPTGFALHMNGEQMCLVTHRNADKKKQKRLVMDIGPQLGHWSHVTVSWNGRFWTIHLNGMMVADSRKTHFPAFIPNPHKTPLVVGGYTKHTNNTFCGLVDEVRIWDHALSQKEIEQTILDDLK